MGLVYLTTNLPYKSTVHVGKYTIPMDPSWDKCFTPALSRQEHRCLFFGYDLDPAHGKTLSGVHEGL